MIKRTIGAFFASALIMAALVSASSAHANGNEKVILCHAAGPAGTTHYETLEVARPAAFGESGHFYENGTPRAGHEQDYLGPCLTDEPSAPPTTTPPSDSPSGPSSDPTLTPSPTPSPTPTSTPSPTPTPTPSALPSPSSTPSATPDMTLPPTDTCRVGFETADCGVTVGEETNLDPLFRFLIFFGLGFLTSFSLVMIALTIFRPRGR